MPHHSVSTMQPRYSIRIGATRFATSVSSVGCQAAGADLGCDSRACFPSAPLYNLTALLGGERRRWPIPTTQPRYSEWQAPLAA